MKSLRDIKDALNQKFLERSSLIDGMLSALLAKEPLLMVGPPGTAKSAICEALCSAIDGKYFSWMMNKFTVTEELFGPLSLKALEDDRYTRVITGKLPDADIAYLDEVFKGSSAILNTMLTIMNERVFFDDAKRTKVPLQTAFASSNEIPDAEELSAFYDRFVLRFFVSPVKSQASVEALFTGFGQVSVPSISMKELAKAQEESQKLPIPKDTLELLVKLRRETESQGFIVSDRKWVQSVRVLRGFAYLNGHKTVEADDLSIYQHMIWSKPDQIPQARKMVLGMVNPNAEKILKIVDEMRDLEQSLDKDGTNEIEAFTKVKTAIETLKKLRKDNKASPALEEAIAEGEKLKFHIANVKLGMGV